MDDAVLGLLGGIGEGLKSGYLSYREALKEKEDQKYKNALLERQNRQDQIQSDLIQAKIRELDKDNDKETPKEKFRREFVNKYGQEPILDESGVVSGVKDIPGLIRPQSIARPTGPKEPKTVTSSEASQIGDIDYSLSELNFLKDEISKNKNLLGLSTYAKVKSPIGFSAEKKLSSDLARVAQNVGKSLEGGKMTDADRDFYKKEILPNLVRDPELALEQIDSLVNAVNRRRSSNVNALTQAGYQTKGFLKDQNKTSTSMIGKIVEANGKQYKVINNDGDLEEVK